MIRWLVALAVGVPDMAGADVGEISVGPRLEVASPFALRAAAAARLGVTDWAALEAHAGGSLDQSGTLARLGVVASLDVFTWVPEALVAVGLGSARGEARARGLAELRLRGYFAARGSLALAGGVEWDDGHWLALASLTVWAGVF